MIIAHQKRFIFVHTWKVAGTSIKAALRPYADVMYRKYTPRRVLYVLGLIDQIGEHATALELRNKLPAEVFENYYKFAFVRNPWDWQVSLYHYIGSHRLHPQHRQVKALAGFNEYLEWRVENDLVLQKSFVTDTDDRLLVDYLGRYENLHSDFAEICATVGIAAALPHKNLSQHSNYQHYYDAYARELIQTHYAPDIEYFGYRYGEGVADRDLSNS